MVTKKTKAALIEATTVSPQVEAEKQPSDIKIVYGPLLTYGLVAIGIVSLIISSAVLLNDPIQQYETDIALFEQEAKPLVTTENTTLTKNTQDTITVVEAVEAVEIVQTVEATAQAVEVTAQTPPVSTAEAQPAEITETTVTQTVKAEAIKPIEKAASKVEPKTNSSQHFARMVEQDKRLLAQLEINHQRQLKTLRQQLNYQPAVLEQNIKQLQSFYDMQTTSLKRSQKMRSEMLNRI